MDTQNKSGESPAEKKDDEQRAVVAQPQGNNMITSGVVVPFVPMPVIVVRGGLDGLAVTSHLFIKQRVDIGEVVHGWERPNEYDVFGSMGTKLYFMEEDTNCCAVCCLGTQRAFSITVFDHNHDPAFLIKRSCSSWFVGYCSCGQGQCVKVSLPDGTLLGVVQQRYSCHNPTFDVLDHQLKPVLKIYDESMCICKTCGNHREFQLLDLNEVEVGVIKKHWSGLFQELFTDADNFGIEFPPSLDVTVKAVLLGAIVLIDFLYFEDDEGRTCWSSICNDRRR